MVFSTPGLLGELSQLVWDASLPTLRVYRAVQGLQPLKPVQTCCGELILHLDYGEVCDRGMHGKYVVAKRIEEELMSLLQQGQRYQVQDVQIMVWMEQ